MFNQCIFDSFKRQLHHKPKIVLQFDQVRLRTEDHSLLQ